jgi:hypothetical protein
MMSTSQIYPALNVCPLDSLPLEESKAPEMGKKKGGEGKEAKAKIGDDDEADLLGIGAASTAPVLIVRESDQQEDMSRGTSSDEDEGGAEEARERERPRAAHDGPREEWSHEDDVVEAFGNA